MSERTGEKVLNLPLGIFKGYEVGDRIENVSFSMSVPKIPFSILNGIVADFKRQLNREDMRQIVYDRQKDEYMVFRPVCQCTKTAIEYVFPKLTRSQVLVMTIHSHNTMEAEFSGTDDYDEVITGLYGVVGMLHTRRPEMSFRASLDGGFVDVDMDDIFSYDNFGGYIA